MRDLELREIRRRLISLGFKPDPNYRATYDLFLPLIDFSTTLQDERDREQPRELYSEDIWVPFSTVEELELAMIYQVLRSVRRRGVKKRAAAAAYLKEMFLIDTSPREVSHARR